MFNKITKNNLIIVFLLVILLCISCFGCFQHKKIASKKQEIKRLNVLNTKVTHKDFTYSDTLKEFFKEEDIKIVKINEYSDKFNNVMSIELNYKGTLERFYDILRMLHKKENLIGIKKIEVKSDINNKIVTYVICDFVIT